MKKEFYILGFDYMSKKYWYLRTMQPKTEEEAQSMYFDFWNLEVCTPLNTHRVFELESYVKGEKAKFNLFNGEVPVVKKEILDDLQLYTKGFEFFPVKIDGEETDYFIVNVMNEVDCIDKKNSNVKIVKDPKDVTSKRKMVIGGSANFKFDEDIEYPDIFRVKYGYQIIGVSQKVKGLMEKMELKELTFTPFLPE